MLLYTISSNNTQTNLPHYNNNHSPSIHTYLMTSPNYYWVTVFNSVPISWALYILRCKLYSWLKQDTYLGQKIIDCIMQNRMIAQNCVKRFVNDWMGIVYLHRFPVCLL